MSVEYVFELRYQLRGKLFLSQIISALYDKRYVALAGNALVHTLLSQILADLEVSFVSEHTTWLGLRPIIIVILVEKVATLASIAVWKEAATELLHH